MKKYKFTYEKSGVNIAAADNFVKFISKISPKIKVIKNLKILEVLALYQVFLKILKDHK